MRNIFILIVVSFLAGCKNEIPKGNTWTVLMHQPNVADSKVVTLPENLTKTFLYENLVNGVDVSVKLLPEKDFTVFKIQASKAEGTAEVYFSLVYNYKTGTPYNFNGVVESIEIFRQSPHDVDAWISEGVAKQAVPMIAVQHDNSFAVALNGSPAFYNNFTSQVFDVERETLSLSSGDNGQAPGSKPIDKEELDIEYNTEKSQKMAPGKILSYYHPIDSENSHMFEGILFSSKATNLNGLRKDVNQFAAEHFSNGEYEDYFGALSFTTAYMNLRVNETGKSKYWVVPSVEYGNTQYGRDAFWISMMLSPEFDAACMQNELSVVNNYAEYPLMSVIWAYRAIKENKAVDLQKVQDYVDAIEKRARDNYFYSFLESDGRLDFQYWGDVIAFEKDDVVTYNQGLFALVLLMAKDLGLSIQSNPDAALRNYQNLYNEELGFFPISKKKLILGPDPLVPDLMAQLFFNTKLLDSQHVQNHFDRVVKNSKTPFGFKVVATPDGAYLCSEAYDIPGYVSQVNHDKISDGTYFRGGSYFLYDNLFLIDAYLHGIQEAEDLLIWRVGLDFKIGNTTFETLNTQTGEPWKPNMGWNIAIYAIWRKLVDEGAADRKLFDTINDIASTN